MPVYSDVPRLTSLENAARQGDLLQVRRLLKGKLRRKGKLAAHAKGRSGWTLLHYASFHGHKEIVFYLVEKCKVKVNTTNDLGDTAIYCACSAGNVDIARYLHAMGADAQLLNLEASTPLHVACVQGHLEVVKFLVEDVKASVHCKEIQGATPLHCACYRGHAEVARYLIESCKASVNSQSKIGTTPLHLACTSNRLEIVMYLVESCRANIEAKNDFAQTPLRVAVHQGFLHLVQFLVVHGKAAVNEPDPVDGTTMLDVAKMRGHSEIAVFLLKYAVPDSVIVTDDVDTMTHLTEPYDDLGATGGTGEEEKVEDTHEIPAALEFDDVGEPIEPVHVAPSESKEIRPTPRGLPALVEESAGYDGNDGSDQLALAQRIEYMEGLLQRVESLEAQLLEDGLPDVEADSNIATRLERLEEVTGMRGKSNLVSLPERPPMERESIRAIIGNIDDDEDRTAE